MPIGSKIFMYMRSSITPEEYDIGSDSAIVSGGATDSVSYRYIAHTADYAGIAGSLTYRDSAPVIKYKVICGDD